MTDDCQCAVFELGMTLLSTALLADVSDVYNGYHLKKDHLARLLLQAKHIYAMDIVDDLNWHLFELVCQMTQPHLTDRFTL